MDATIGTPSLLPLAGLLSVSPLIWWVYLSSNLLWEFFFVRFCCLGEQAAWKYPERNFKTSMQTGKRNASYCQARIKPESRLMLRIVFHTVINKTYNFMFTGLLEQLDGCGRREKSIVCTKERIEWLFHNSIETVNCG
jgi:hypothetical protein